MAFVPVSIRFGDDDEPLYHRSIELTQRQLLAFEHEAGNMSVPLRAIGEDMHTQIAAAFASEGLTGASGHWVALSSEYASWKESKGFGLPLLVGLRPTSWVGHRSNPPGERRNMEQTYAVSGEMAASLMMPLIDQLTWQISPTRLRYDPTSKIAGWHEYGTDKMPARPPVDLSLTFLHSVDRQFVRWLAAIMKRFEL